MTGVRALALTAMAGALAALASAPARADYYAFLANKQNVTPATLTLSLADGSKVIVGEKAEGWLASGTFSLINRRGGYLAGVVDGTTYANYFEFDIPTVKATVTSAALNLYSGSISTNLEYSLFGANGALDRINGFSYAGTNFYNELVSGPKYTSSPFALSPDQSFSSLLVSLNDAAVLSDINKAGGPGGNHTLVMAGMVVGVPEPSTWAMLIVGFAGLAVLSYRRASARGSRIA